MSNLPTNLQSALQSALQAAALWTPPVTAEFLGCSEWTLAAWRCAGTGPKYLKLGGRVRYSAADVAAWVESHTATSTAAHSARKAG